MNSSLSRALLVFALAAAGCQCDVRVNPEGLRCDPGNICPAGFACAGGICHATGLADGGEACAGVDCTTPPASQCQDANTRRTFTAGACDKATAQCVWTTQDTTCPQGCQNGGCIGDPCNSVSCTTPPSAECASSTTLRTYGNPGTCSAGTCTYPPTDTTCTNGCAGGVCVNQNLCAGVTCTTPPGPSCSGSNRLTYASPGTCNSGTGQCTYPQSSTPCPTGCTAGACNALNFTQTAPKVRHLVDAVDLSTSSVADRVLAVGPAGAVSYFDGTGWSRVDAGTPNDLTAVWYSGSSSAWVVGKNRTVLRWNGAQFQAVNNVPGSGSTTFVGVHGVTDTDVVLADETGGWYRYKSGSWSNGQLSSTNQPYAMRSVYVDPAGRTRIAGLCARGTASAKGCVAYNSADAGTWYEDLDGTASTSSEGFMAVGPTTTVASTDAWAGRFPSNVLRRHPTSGAFDSTGVPALPAGGGVVGITGTAASAAVRAVFLLSASDAANPSNLYRATLAGADSEPLLQNYFNGTSLSKNENSGVIVADKRLGTPVANNVFRRGAIVNEALDLGEDWAGFDASAWVLPGSGSNVNAIVAASVYNDIAIRAVNGARWYFRRGPYADVTDLAAGNNFAFLTGRLGKLYKFTVAGQFQQVSTSVVADFNAACRATDTELYAVGNGGNIVSFGGALATSATSMTSGTAKNLIDVHCPAAGSAVACGQDGTVLVYRNSAWSAVTPAFPNAAAQLTSCRLMGGAIYAAGNGAFAKYEAGAWTTLASRATLSDLVPLSATDIYAASGTDVVRFDGSAWSSRFVAPTTLRAGGQVGARVVYAGNSGVVVEGQ